MQECSVEGCDRKPHARGYCGTHYRRWRLGQDIEAPVARQSPTREAALNDKTVRRGECLEWTGYKNAGGYGMMSVNNHPTLAHRYAWEQANGPIPDGMFIDHMCWNPACVDVSHLRLVTPKQNSENHSPGRPSRTGVRGVYPSGKKFECRVFHDGTSYRIGLFDTIEEANAAVVKARAKLFTHSQN